VFLCLLAALVIFRGIRRTLIYDTEYSPLDDEYSEEERNNVVGTPDEEGLVIQPKVRCTLCMGEISH